ncbi:MAG: 5-formyltetrahydrofolate cyclo-ligase [Bermanella sp.]
MNINIPQERDSIRQHMRQLRMSLSPQQQLLASRKLSQLLMSQPWFQRAHNIAIYLAHDGEIDPRVFADKALHRKKLCHLPSLHPLKQNHLWFADYDGPRINNKYGIAEPDPKRNQMLNGNQLDVVLLPLVAFDEQGGRLGMGGGFYDRTFAFLNNGKRAQKPKLIGLAHHFQQVAQLPVENWDVALDAIVTDEKVIPIF